MNDTAKIERIRELFTLLAPMLQIEADLAQQFLKEAETAPPAECDVEKEMRAALIETAQVTLVIANTLLDTSKSGAQRLRDAHSLCAQMGYDIAGITDTDDYSADTAFSELGIHLH